MLATNTFYSRKQLIGQAPHWAVTCTVAFCSVVELDSEVIGSNPRLLCKVKRSREVKLQMLVGK